MRRVLVLPGVVIAGLAVVLLRSCAAPLELDAPCARAAPVPPESMATVADAATAPTRREAPAPAVASTQHDPLVLIFCAAGTMTPFAPDGVRLWLYGPEGNRARIMPVTDDGRAEVARDELAAASGIAFEISLPELRGTSVVQCTESLGHLRDRALPLHVPVPRGRRREVVVIDEGGRAIPDARIEGDRVLPVATDTQGIAQPCLPDPAPPDVHVTAPGRRFESVPVPDPAQRWVIVLGRANRLEVMLDTAGGIDGHHVDVLLSASFRARTFHQTKYVQTPGRAVEGTPGWWSPAAQRDASRWHLGVPDTRLAVLDQLHDHGAVEVVLMRFDEVLDRRSLTLPAAGGTTRVVFAVAPPPPPLSLHVTDAAGMPIDGVLVRMAPVRGATIAPSLREGLPIWAPLAITDRAGACRLPRPTAYDEVFVFGKDGLACRVHTFRELLAANCRVRLEPGREVTVEVRGRNGELLSEGWTSGGSDHVHPSAALGHDIWLDTRPGGSDAPLFRFTGLPRGLVEFRFTHLQDRLHHDSDVAAVRFVAPVTLDDLMLGK